MKLAQGDLYCVLSELRASSDVLIVAEELLRCRLVSASDLFVGWIEPPGGLQVVYVGPVRKFARWKAPSFGPSKGLEKDVVDIVDGSEARN